MNDPPGFQWDAFISHASEDKADFVEPLAGELQKYGIKVWFDKFTLRIGSSLRESIDEGLRQSRFGIVVLSHNFFAKNWPKKELNALFARQVDGHDVILPVWRDLQKEELLEYSPLLADLVAVKSTVGLEAVARLLAEIIRPEAFRIETTRADAQNAADRMLEQLRDLHPALDCRVSFGPQEVDVLKRAQAFTPSDAVITCVRQGVKLEFVAPDMDAYSKSPLSVGLTMTEDARERLYDGLRKGTIVEFGPKDAVKVDSQFLEALSGPDAFSQGVSRMVVGPPAGLTYRRLKYKLTFALGLAKEEFPYLEFELRGGAGSIELRSSTSSVPFDLTLKVAGVTRDMRVNLTYPGHEIRRIRKAHRAFNLFMGGGTIEIFDLESDVRVGVVAGATRTSPREESDVLMEAAIEALYEVAIGLGETFIWPAETTQKDFMHLYLVQKILRTGEVSFCQESIVLSRDPSPDGVVPELQDTPEIIRMPLLVPPTFATLFGKTIDLGPCSLEVKPDRFEVVELKDGPGGVTVRAITSEPLTFRFDRYPRAEPAGEQELAS